MRNTGLIPGLVSGLVAALAVAPGAWAALPDDPRCLKPEVTVKTVFAPEKVTYDFAGQIKGGKKAMGVYDPYDMDFSFGGKITQGCLHSITYRINIRPVIRLLAGYKNNKKQDCGRRQIIEHERGHDRSTKADFKWLAKTIKRKLEKHFTAKTVPDSAAMAEEVNGLLDRNFISGFFDRLWAGYDAFHQQLASRDIILKKCTLVKRKR